MSALPKQKMTSRAFLDWAQAQPKGKYELIAGEIVAMAPERARHVIAKLNVARAFQDAIREAGRPCIVFTDGMSVVIDDETTYEPDATVQCGSTVDLDSVVADQPMIVVEVLSPSSVELDMGHKLANYLTLASIAHVLIVDPLHKIAFLHSKTSGPEITTRIIRQEGKLRFGPPDVIIDVKEFFEGV